MPRRREKRTDTQNSDSFGQEKHRDKIVHFGTVRFNRMLAPDQVQGDDSSKYSILAWSNTLQAQRLLPWNERKELFKRALSYLPYSYKIWHMFLSEFTDYCSTRSVQSREYGELNRQFDEALSKLPKMPRIWLMYSAALEKQQMISKAREVYNWSFRNLPLTQHEKIWRRFAEWAMRLDNAATALRVVPRYMKINPDFKQTYADYLIAKKLYDRAAAVYQAILDDQGYSGKAGKESKDFYFQLIQLLTQHPQAITCIDGHKFIRDGLKLYPGDAGKIWVKLSDYFIRLGEFDRARETLEEAIESVDNAKDFGIIFSAYVKFSEEMITALANEEIKSHFQVVETDNVDYEIRNRIERLEKLLKRQPFLLLNISIKNNPNNVQNWLNLINLYIKGGDLELAEAAIERAIATVVPEQAEGKLSEIWLKYTELLQNQGQLRRCNQILHQAIQVPFKMTEDSLTIWRRWAEMLVEEGFYEDALKVAKQVLFRKKTPSQAKSKNTEESLKGHATLWQLYIDLEINLGNFETVKTAFERCKQQRSLTPLMLLNYTNFLWDNAYFEQTFRVFEFALSNFKWPSLNQIWLSYIHKFIKRHGNSAAGVERARSIFQRLLREVPHENASTFYFIYAEFEENYGLYSHAVEIYDRMIKVVPANQKFEAYSIYIAKVSKMLGITKTRAVFQHALQNLPQSQILIMGRKYTQMEANLGQVERARGIFGHISQFTDPRDDNEMLWKDWEKFEVEYGDRQTYKEYLRIKRSVEAKYAMLPPDLEKIEAEIKKGLL